MMNRIKWIGLSLWALVAGAAGAMEADWQAAKEEDGVSVATAQIGDSKFVAFRAEIHIDASVQEILAVLTDHESYPEWYDNCKETEVIEWGEAQSALVRVTIKTPFPLANRDAVNYVTIEPQADGTMVRMVSLPDRVAEVKGLVRMSIADGSWWLEPNGSGTRVVHFYNADPKARVPAWMVNRFVVDGPIRSLSALRDRVEI